MATDQEVQIDSPSEQLMWPQDKEIEIHNDGLWMVLFSTLVAVFGSLEFGSCVGYSAPTQFGIMKDLGLSLYKYSIFGSILNIGAMVGASTSGPIADFLGRKGSVNLLG
ncbi:hypothetical protein NE237_011375 [Protea cynaroides]|uniref:Major facilitator superfamily (MFS) profile domain-containing protein n=1 Tax=Protea cynaroides TaxID=273540 RepID=A0A9Q0GUU0_9MAGN|nr:hypothetical protein NE237_011375 [Protea cynaroides]